MRRLTYVFQRFTIITLIGILLIPSVISNGSINDNKLAEISDIDFLTVEDLDWTAGGFACDNATLTLLSMEGFDYNITDELHFIENVNGTYYPVGTSYVSVGAYATVPVINGMLNFSFTGRARAGHLDAVNIALRVYNTDMDWLKSGASHPDELGGIVLPGVYDTGYFYSEHNVTLEGFEEAVIFFSYNDYYAAVWEQEFWITDLRVETIKEVTDADDTNPDPEDIFILTAKDLEWTAGGFSCDNGTLTFLSMEGFEYSITDEIHFIETGYGTYYPVGTSYVAVGAYATVPVLNGKLNFSFNGRAKAGHLDAVDMSIRIYSENLTWLKSGASHPEEIGGINSGLLDTGYICIENNVTLEGIDKAIIFISYNDYFADIWEQEFWVSDLKIEVPVSYDDHIPGGIFTIPIPIPIAPITLAIIVLSLIALKRKKK
ncbi:MAG: hypothetical protein ACTSVO_10700 [Candidatus Heimdallarchaeaceae archaeon]